MISWREAVTFANFLSADASARPSPGADKDRQVTYGVMGNLPVIIFDKEHGKRRVVPMRWGGAPHHSVGAGRSPFMPGQRLSRRRHLPKHSLKVNAAFAANAFTRRT